MNFYDIKGIICATCKKSTGKVDFNALIIHFLCRQCANPVPKRDDIPCQSQYLKNRKVSHSA